jgi:hypothetical protein
MELLLRKHIQCNYPANLNSRLLLQNQHLPTHPLSMCLSLSTLRWVAKDLAPLPPLLADPKISLELLPS